ncbi:hypothetical protein GCM10010168_53010 [Actinoplanes ianthinogenes]|uniref:Uncharacterized protein n=1 Tax=Actinoplanes ianthinogenes TaxID=122358 RepID=A0ABM7LR50_9ACTN|nr:DUF4406 domain-containing protein [Actinoplanes ianthinogenes]BCJ41701.1 hypothetical protein Aiant_23580 [Actinoplanes ianthinogenes]GGR28316.1 hypothetical protein GCM10010168_53010 [Actinoplanes ianthinogenes]
MTERALRVYVPGSAGDTPAKREENLAPLLAALAATGHEVIAPGVDHPDAAPYQDQAQAVTSSLDLLRSADYVVIPPGFETSWEATYAELLGLKVCTLPEAADILGA